MLLAVQAARAINYHCGAGIIAPWDVSQLPEEWIELFPALGEMERMRAGFQAFDKRLEEIRRAHPNYRKYQ